MNPAEDAADKIEQLLNLDMTGRGIIKHLFEASRKLSGSPASLIAANTIVERVTSGKVVLMGTGFSVNPERICETDGPVGAALLARALDRAFGAKVAVVTQKGFFPATGATLRAVGLPVHDLEGFRRSRHAVTLIDFPLDLAKAGLQAKSLIDDLNPSAVIMIEAPGMNSKGFYHSMRGFNITEHSAKQDLLVEESRRRGIATVGIGDGGNEIGMGGIADAIRRYVPYGAECQCDCKAGIAAREETDVLVTATVSNWGADAIIANLAYKLKNADLMHDGDLERSAIEACSMAGAIDGVTGYCDPSVDGFGADLHASVVKITRSMLKREMRG